jgi:hypothetical protein
VTVHELVATSRQMASSREATSGMRLIDRSIDCRAKLTGRRSTDEVCSEVDAIVLITGNRRASMLTVPDWDIVSPSRSSRLSIYARTYMCFSVGIA